MVILIAVIARFIRLDDPIATAWQLTIVATSIGRVLVTIVTFFYPMLDNAVAASSGNAVISTAIVVVTVPIVTALNADVNDTIATG